MIKFIVFVVLGYLFNNSNSYRVSLSDVKYEDEICLTKFEYTSNGVKTEIDSFIGFQSSGILFAYNQSWTQDYITVSSGTFNFEICLNRIFPIHVCAYYIYPNNAETSNPNNYRLIYQLDNDNTINYKGTLTVSTVNCQGDYNDCVQVVWNSKIIDPYHITSFNFTGNMNNTIINDNRRFVDVQCYYNNTNAPTMSPTNQPTHSPVTPKPTLQPTPHPSIYPTKKPTPHPTTPPTLKPSKFPTNSPTNKPTYNPTPSPTPAPTQSPTDSPTDPPTHNPTNPPTRMCESCCPTPSPEKDSANMVNVHIIYLTLTFLVFLRIF